MKQFKTYNYNGYTPKQKDIVWINLNPTQGREMNKRRPVIVISRDEYNAMTGFVIVCPITSTKRDHYIKLASKLETNGYIDYFQVKSIDFQSKERDIAFIEQADLQTFGLLAQRFRQLFDFKI
ncbi:hypothetical protein AWM75_00710 [Aerococcus urinaehominis]|uniref:Uncharacterized protein n=1 Tax=Aerococcus urinaehominis TaxID=128944 RepID=A0A0X8FL31_9LACT|nr:type II toxin-antitoxin system PemK/MazF family toxin [Aerococcus urinaehominis]AMB98602.1 hypothetical protein AWM75_00710 [Aerococcus urinaehominis]